MRVDRLIRVARGICMLVGVGMASVVGAAPLALTDIPLTMSTSIDPNIMLLVDDSGSMEEIIWHEGYDPEGSYGAWQYRGSSSWSSLNASTTYYPNNFRRDNCSSGYSRFRRSSGWNSYDYKCLRLPEPNGGGNTRYRGNYVRFLLDNFNGDLTQGAIPNDYRMNVAREVAKDLVQNTPGMRFGLSHFNNQHGGRIVAECGASTDSILSQIDDLKAVNWTPVAESLYEVTRYFRGLSSHYNNGSYTSPIQYRCQKNFTVVITDGLPTYDGRFPSNDPDDPDGLLPNWDQKNNDGPGTESSTEGNALFLDDIAKFAWDIDMRKTGHDEAGGSFNDPRYPKQNMHTYTIGFTVDNEMLADAAEYGQGIYSTANNAEQLKEELRKALTNIQSKLGATASAATSSGSVHTGARVYQARLNSQNWTGQLLAFSIETDRSSTNFGGVLSNGPGPEGAQWDAGNLLPGWSNRKIITNSDGDGVPFRWDSFDAVERTEYFDGKENLLEYLRGRSVTGYRVRGSLLGDIVNSAPQYVGPPGARYPWNLEGESSSESYAAFKELHKERDAMIYVGANDGMLHAFDAVTGQERLAFVPAAVLDRVKALADPEYVLDPDSLEIGGKHQYYVDGTPTVVDAFVNNGWKTVLVGGLNKGGQAIYALDVTDPSKLSEDNASSTFLWEFSDEDDADLGYTYSRPAIVKMQNGTWVAVFGNGYNNTVEDGHVSASGNAVLFVVDLATGSLLRKIDTGVGADDDPTGANRPNGLATVSPVDIEGDNKTDYVYAGDLFGNLWKFDLSASNTNQWKAYKLFEACSANTCTASNRQPITSAPSVIRHPLRASDGQIVLFGTGKYLELSDNIAVNGGVQSFYAILDDNKNGKPVSRSSLVKQTILSEQSVTADGADSYVRVTSENEVNWRTEVDPDKGWYIDLVSPSGFQGERQVTNSLVRSGRVIFTSMIPSNTSDPCEPAGTSWLMEMDAYSGARLSFSPFDLNADGMFSKADFVTIVVDGEEMLVPVSGLRLDGGHAQTPAIMVDPESQSEYKYISTSEGLETVVENPGAFETGRQSWRELFLGH